MKGLLSDATALTEIPMQRDSSEPICNRKIHEKSLKSLKSQALSGGGHGTRRSQKRTNVEIPRRKSAVHVCTRDCTHIYKCYHPISASHLTVFCSRSLLSFCSFLPSFSSPLISPSSMYRILSHMEAILLSCVTVSIVVPSLLIFRNDSITSVAARLTLRTPFVPTRLSQRSGLAVSASPLRGSSCRTLLHQHHPHNMPAGSDTLL